MYVPRTRGQFQLFADIFHGNYKKNYFIFIKNKIFVKSYIEYLWRYNSKISSVIKNCLFEFFVKFLYIVEAILEIHQVILFKKKTYCYSYFTILFLNPLCYGICLLKLKMSNSSSSGMTSELTHMSLTLLFWQFTIFVVSL